MRSRCGQQIQGQRSHVSESDIQGMRHHGFPQQAAVENIDGVYKQRIHQKNLRVEIHNEKLGA